MRATAIAVALCCWTALAIGAEPDLDTLPAAEALPKLIQKMVDALPADPGIWKRYMSDRGVYVSEAGEVVGKADLLRSFGPFPPGLAGSIAVRNPRITDLGDTAIVVFDADEQESVFGQHMEVNYLTSHTWRREDGHWRLLCAHALVQAKDPAPLAVDARKLADFAGTYEVGDWRYRVEAREGRLFGGTGKDLQALIAVGDNVFADAGSSLGVLRVFVRGADGAVAKMVQRRKFADLEWRKTP
jgi:hypothetical protein